MTPEAANIVVALISALGVFTAACVSAVRYRSAKPTPIEVAIAAAKRMEDDKRLEAIQRSVEELVRDKRELSRANQLGAIEQGLRDVLREVQEIRRAS